jgi:formylglycine-generating enzyme required for sulfatase activity
MNHHKDILPELAKKLTAPLAFAVLIVIVVAALGGSIPPVFQALIYIVVIGGMLLYAAQSVAVELAKRKESAPPPAVGSGSPASSAQVNDGAAIQGNNNTTLGAGSAKTGDVGRDVYVVNVGDGGQVNIGQTASSAPTAPPAPSRPLDFDAALDCYIQAVIQDCLALRLVGLDPRASDPGRGKLSLDKLYISLDTTSHVEEKGKKGERPDPEKSRPLSALEALSQCTDRCMVLLGLPGTGKSTFVRYLSLRLAQVRQDDTLDLTALLPDWQGGTLLPLIIPLGRLAESIPAATKSGAAENVETFLRQYFLADPRLECLAPHLDELLRTQPLLVLFDGLDEVANLHLRPVVIQAVEAFARKFGKNAASRFVVTCRTYSYAHDKAWQLTGWPTYELALFTPEKINQFVSAWYDEHARLEPARASDYARKKERLLASLHPDDRRRLSEIAPYPIILTMMAVVHTQYSELPDTRAQVYEKCVDLLLIQWELERSVLPGKTEKRSLLDALNVPRGKLDAALREVAFKAHEGWAENGSATVGPALVTEDLLSGVLKVYLEDSAKVDTFLEYCQSANGLLMLHGTIQLPGAVPDSPPRRVYAFPHLTFEEYLAGRYLEGPGIGERVRKRVQASDRWREVVMLLGEYLCFERQDYERLEYILKVLTPQPFPANPSESDWRSAWLAGDLLILYRRMFATTHPSESESHIIESLRCLIQAGALDLIPRSAAADTLGALGWLPPDLYTFVSVPMPGVTCYMGRYPVTNGQYERFLKAQETDPHWADYWHNLPVFDCPEECYKSLDAVDGRDNIQTTPRFWDDPVFGLSRYGVPVVGVTWYAVNAYCKWLQAHWSELEEGSEAPDLCPTLVRLPTEAEWIAAAGGAAPAARCPWDLPEQVTDDTAIIQRANVDEKVNRTTPMGMYPLGVSQPYGLWDMAGNVWEWQANLHSESHSTLALRGGSWANPVVGARLSARSSGHPNFVWNYLGFRVVVSCAPEQTDYR